jgi:IS1 family transposase/transposase-like protein
MTEGQFEAAFPDEDACKAYLVARRWPNGVICPRCGAVKPFPVGTMPFKWQCYQCAPDSGYRFSHLTGTIFENTNKPLRQWFKVVHLMTTSKKGISSLQIQRQLGFGSYETALNMTHKIRAAMMQPEEKLGGIVEMDETYIGGKDKNKHWDKRGGRRGSKGKTAVIGAVQRKGNVIARILERVTSQAVLDFVGEAISNKVSLLATDDWTGYSDYLRKFPHASVNHRKHQYVVGAVHTNTIEGFWSIFKRGIVGSFHKVSAKYMPLYVAEFQFRYNNRMNSDIFGAVIEGC